MAERWPCLCRSTPSRGQEGRQLSASLTLWLTPDLTDARRRKGKRRLESLTTGDLAADVTDAPDAQFRRGRLTAWRGR
jgi:hypothetical protein